MNIDSSLDSEKWHQKLKRSSIITIFYWYKFYRQGKNMAHRLTNDYEYHHRQINIDSSLDSEKWHQKLKRASIYFINYS